MLWPERGHMVHEEDWEVNCHVLLAAEVDVERVPVVELLLYAPERLLVEARCRRHLGSAALAEEDVVEEGLVHALGGYLPGVGVLGEYVVDGV